MINVTFKYSVKEFNELRKGIHVKVGYDLNQLTFTNSAVLENGELIAVDTTVPVEGAPLSQDQLTPYFSYDEATNCYKLIKNPKTLVSRSKLREYLYENGFNINGLHYVRFKRSPGSARVGKCLFINESLYDKFHKWDCCGLEVNHGDKIDLASFEGAIALTSSDIIDTIQIDPKSILVVDDYESTFEDDIIRTEILDGHLHSSPQTNYITNKIWDGQSLLDVSMFGQYEDKGMLLLRNRFFKSCCFNANIQKWFADNNITEVSQLNGFTLAENIEDIKMITTPSSIKYEKFGKIENWLTLIDSDFGVVKYDKETQ